MTNTDHCEALDDRPLAELSDAELQAAIREGRHGALTEEACRIAMRHLGINDRARVMPSCWNLRTC